MPVSTGVDLYLAKSVGELNNKAEIPNKNVAPKVYVKTAEKLIADANRCNSLGDEEKAYVLFMRYFNIITLIKKSADYKKNKDYYDTLIGGKNLIQAIEKAETLSKSLTNRYEFLEAEQASKKLEALKDEREKIKKENLENEILENEEKKTEENNKGDKELETTPSLFSSGAISASGLYDLLQSSSEEMIIMDTRSSSEFKDSHLRHKSVINVPVEIVIPGTTVPRIETSLPPESKELWSKRANMEYIILLDWNSTIDKVGPGKTLQTLKDALFKFDSQTLLKSSPLILEGGYDEWCLYYPVMTTQPVRDRPIYNIPVSNIPSLDFDYPDLDAAFLTTPTPEVKPTNGTHFGFGLDQSESSPSVLDGGLQRQRPNIPDRAKKPSLTSSSSLDSQNSTQAFDRINNEIKGTKTSLYPSMISSVENNNSLSSTTDTSQNSKVSGNQKSKSNIVAEQERELDSLRNLQSQKKQELLDFQKEKERMALEHKARLEQLKKRQFEIDNLEKMKTQQQKDVADLMRLKRRLGEEMKIERKMEEESNREKITEEKKRTAELERMKLEEDSRIERLKSVEMSRIERKQKEESEKIRHENQRKEEEAAALADAEKARLENIERERRENEVKQREIRENDLKQVEEQLQLDRKKEEQDELTRKKEESEKAIKRTEKERQEKEAEVKRRQEIILQQEQEREEIRKKEEELKIKLEQQRIAEENARLEKERINLEKRERERREKERKDKERAEEAKKIAEERLKKVSEPEKKPVDSQSSMLPVGWQRKLDESTNRYFYLNHNEGTSQWAPPQTTGTSSSPAHSKVYKTKLKDENHTPRSGGLTRSHSSPNIAQLVEEEGKGMPMFNREVKPTVKPLTSNRPVNLKALRKRDLTPVYGSVGGALSGLRNLGNTCYMNSTLQCLNNCYPLISYFLNDTYLEDINRESKFSYNGDVVDEFAVVVKALWSGQYRSISPKEFKGTCSVYNSLFANFDQQDSQEFLAFLLDGLHEGLNRIKHRPKLQELDTDNMQDLVAANKSWANHKLHNESIIQELFQGVLKSTVICLTCRKTSTRFDIFQYLTLPLPTSASGCSIKDCLMLFLREEKLTGSSKWKCPRCKVDREAMKKLDIWKLPHILIIHLNRFFYEGVWRQKLNTFVDFPVTAMDLDNVVAGPRRRKPYNLYAVSNHYGTMEGGHYTAYAKNPCTEDWHTFDDHEVRNMSRSDVKTSAAYFLFYTCLELK